MGFRVVPARFWVGLQGVPARFRVGSGLFREVPTASGSFRVSYTFYIHPFCREGSELSLSLRFGRITAKKQNV